MKKKIVRILALFLALILLIMIIATLVVAIVPFESSDRIFKGLLSFDIVIPVILYLYLMIFKWAKSRDERLNSSLDEIDRLNSSLNEIDRLNNSLNEIDGENK